ncbi:hypothetical protein C8R44DRAFT_724608 [Mycena epipterygia]|nr:hypothetical protein C8R44DRAFT_724608 [Mycena epipterygia]
MRNDGRKFVGLCFWHPDLSASQMLAIQASWDARSRYPAGMQKMTAEQIKAEKTWQNKVKSSIVKELGEATAASASPGFSLERLDSEGNKKDNSRRKSEPKDSVRVKNRSQISSMGHEWRELAMIPSLNLTVHYDEPADKGDDVLPIAELNAREDVDIWNKKSEMEDEMVGEAAGVKSMLSKREVQGRYN